MFLEQGCCFISFARREGCRRRGGGEAGAEAVLPLSSFYSELAAILDERLAALQHTGPLIEQHNEYHSPKALSPAEAARETREATRQAVRAIRK